MFQCNLIWMESLSLYSIVITITSFTKSVLNSGDVMSKTHTQNILFRQLVGEEQNKNLIQQ